MTYVTSDLHGYPFEKFQALLNSVGFSENDMLYILGDVVDKGKDGVKHLQWSLDTPNVTLLLGNHEDMLRRYEFLFDPDKEDITPYLHGEEEFRLCIWTEEGGTPTLEGLCGISAAERAGGSTSTSCMRCSGIAQSFRTNTMMTSRPYSVTRPPCSMAINTVEKSFSPTHGSTSTSESLQAFLPCCCGWMICSSFRVRIDELIYSELLSIRKTADEPMGYVCRFSCCISEKSDKTELFNVGAPDRN